MADRQIPQRRCTSTGTSQYGGLDEALERETPRCAGGLGHLARLVQQDGHLAVALHPGHRSITTRRVLLATIFRLRRRQSYLISS